MRSITKRSYQEFIDYIDFPTVVYIYETGSILAINDYAKNILGNEIKDINLILRNQIKQKFSRKVLNNGSEIILNKVIDLGEEKQAIDMEVNAFLLDKYHVVFCFFELTQKHYFTEHLKNQIPRMLWLDDSLNLLGLSNYSRRDMNVDLDETILTNQNILEDELSDKLLKEDIEIIKSYTNKYNVMEEFKVRNGESFFVRLQRMPIVNKNEKIYGLVYVYTLILNQEEKNNLLQNTLKENVVLKEVVSKSGTIIVRWNTDIDWSIEYISPNIIKYGYGAEDFNSNKLLWKDIIHPDDYLRVYNMHTSENRKISFEDQPLVLEYRILTTNNEIKWVREESITIHENSRIGYREGVINDITYEKELEKELFDNKDIFKIKINDLIVSDKMYDSVNFWNLIDLEYMKLFQESIEQITGIWNFMVDNKGNIISEIIVKKGLKTEIYENISVNNYITNIKMLSKECMDTGKMLTNYYFNNELAITVIPFIFGERKVGTWFLIGSTINKKSGDSTLPKDIEFLSNIKPIPKKSYEKIITFVSSYVKGQCNTILQKLELIDQKKKITEESNKLEKQLEKARIITKILQLSHLERPYVEILNNIFNKVADFSAINKVIIYKTLELNNEMAIQYEWQHGEGLPKGRKNQQIVKKVQLLHDVLVEKDGFVLFYESDNNPEYNEFFLNSKVNAAAISHLTLNSYNDCIILFTNSSKENARWKDVEVNLLREILPIIQNVILKAKSLDTFNMNKIALYKMLDNLNEYVLVISKIENRILYMNKYMVNYYSNNIIGISFFDFCLKNNINIYQDYDVFLKYLEEDKNLKYKCYDNSQNHLLTIQANRIKWFDGQDAFVLNIRNISRMFEEFKNDYLYLFD